MSSNAAQILNALQARAVETSDRNVLGQALVAAVRDVMPQASWVGLYWLHGAHLELGPYIGPPTEHTRIPVGQGVCGTAIAEDRDQLVEDVSKVGNYLACSPSVRSEVVVLIRSRGAVIGQLDLDADRVAAFDEDDMHALRAAAVGFGGLIDA